MSLLLYIIIIVLSHCSPLTNIEEYVEDETTLLMYKYCNHTNELETTQVLNWS